MKYNIFNKNIKYKMKRQIGSSTLTSKKKKTRNPLEETLDNINKMFEKIIKDDINISIYINFIDENMNILVQPFQNSINELLVGIKQNVRVNNKVNIKKLLLLFLLDKQNLLYLFKFYEYNLTKNKIFIDYLYSMNNLFSIKNYQDLLNINYNLQGDKQLNYLDYTPNNIYESRKALFKEIIEKSNYIYESESIEQNRLISYINKIIDNLEVKDKNNLSFIENTIYNTDLKCIDITVPRKEKFEKEKFKEKRFNRDKKIQKVNDKLPELIFKDFLIYCKNNIKYMDIAKKNRAIDSEGNIDGNIVGKSFENEVERILVEEFNFTYLGHKLRNIDVSKLKPGSFIKEPSGGNTYPDFIIVMNETVLKLECKSIQSGNTMKLGNTIPDLDTIYLILKNDENGGFVTYLYGINIVDEEDIEVLKTFKQDIAKEKHENVYGVVNGNSNVNFSANLTSKFDNKLRNKLEMYVENHTDFFDTGDENDPFVDYECNVPLINNELYKFLEEKMRLDNTTNCEMTKNMLYGIFMIKQSLKLNVKEEKSNIIVSRSEKNDSDSLCGCINHFENVGIYEETDVIKNKFLKMYEILNKQHMFICHICMSKGIIDHKILKYVKKDFDYDYPIIYYPIEKDLGDLYIPIIYSEIPNKSFYERVDSFDKLQKLKEMEKYSEFLKTYNLLEGVPFIEKREMSSKINNIETWQSKYGLEISKTNINKYTKRININDRIIEDVRKFLSQTSFQKYEPTMIRLELSDMEL